MPDKPETCPICDERSQREYRPFCSRGCKDRDLLQWLGDGYRIPGPAVPHEGLDSDSEES